MNKFFSLSIALSFTSIVVLSQHLENPVNIHSPNASNLGQFGDVPVSYFTGTPLINIPLHVFSEKGFDLQISLNYDASGIREENHPSWVGQNWNLSAGGVITRTIVGIPDETNFVGTGIGSYVPGGETPLGFMYRGNLSITDINSLNKLKNLAEANKMLGYDYEPDIFTFNFLGKTGKFFMGNDGKWKVQSDENLKIIFEEEQLIYPVYENLPYPLPYRGLKYPKVIGGFKIKDENGNTYVFGYDINTVELSIDFFQQALGNIWTADAWYLSKVIDKHGNEIYNLNYERGDFITHFYRNYTKTISGFRGYGFFSPNCDPSSLDMSENYYIGGRLISPVYLKKIETVNNTIIFHRSESNEISYDPNILQLLVQKYYQDVYVYYDGNCHPFHYLNIQNPFFTSIDVVNSLKWNKLDFITWTTGAVAFDFNNSPLERLNLLGVTKWGEEFNYNQANAPKYKYNFNYNNFQDLPGYLSKKVDHWGYFKGTEYIIDKNKYENFYSTRVPSSSHLLVGLLNRVEYPTGGYTQYTFEPHTYNKIVHDNNTELNIESGVAGGVRVKMIIDFDGANSITRNFKYVLNYSTNNASTTSSGILSYKPKYFWDNWNVRLSGEGVYSEDVFSINSIIPLSNSFGGHIGYSEVVVLSDDGSYALYKYSNFGPSFYDVDPITSLNLAPSPYDKISDLSLLRGKLLNVSLFNTNNTLVQEKNYTYRTGVNTLIDSPNYFIIGTNADYRNVCANAATSVFTGNAYKIFFFDFDVIKEETKHHFGSNSILEETLFEKFDNNSSTLSNVRLTRSISSIKSDGSYLKQYFYYPLDMGLSDLVNSFRIGEIVQTLNQNDSFYIGATKIGYKTMHGLFVPGVLMKSNKGFNELETEITYDRYDQYGNLTQLTLKDGIKTSIIWGYNQTLPIAEVKNASSFQISYSSFETPDNKGNWEFNNSPSHYDHYDFRTGSRSFKLYYSSISKYLYPGTYMLSYWLKEGTTTFTGGTVEDIYPSEPYPNGWVLYKKKVVISAPTTFIISGGGTNVRIDELRLHAIDAQMTTYTYDPLIGVTSVTDPNNRTTYYEYDGLGRLQTVKDEDGNILKHHEYKYYDQVDE